MKGLMIRFYSWMATRKEGATAVEYALIVAGIAVAIIIAVFALGDQLSDMFDYITGELGVPTTPTAT